MRLLVVVNVYRPDLGGGVLFADLCEGLAQRGFDVEVRCAYPYYPEWTDKSGQNGWQIRSKREAGVYVRRFGLYIPTRPSSLAQRLVYEGSFFASLVREMPEPDEFDLVMVFCPLVGAVAYGALAAWASGCPLWLNVQDLSAQAAASSGIVKSGAVARAMASVQAALFNKADIWSTISPVMFERLSELRARGQDVLLLPNWLHSSLRSELVGWTERSPMDPVQLFYSGNIGAKQNLVTFCAALHRSNARFQFLIRGGGSGAALVREWVASTGDSRISFEELGSERDLAVSLSQSDLFVVTERTGAGGSFIPSKILPSMAAGLPLLAVCDVDSPLGVEMHTSEAGVRLDWDRLDDLDALLTNLPSRADVWGAWKQAALDRSEMFDRDRLLDAYAERIQMAIESE